ncbi:uroporphyrinogen-III C-methyltransferase [Clostridium algidicarnis]|uniref:uroporphyrinogen-III C-methyltransferase n=2 Tax=Clostridium algidicarnis TaxID=37659 RepID=A0A2S6FXE2_9CLOT|nr:uroporphyrinogen-III C-methyltransferase [Clostridium algidicarnis]MBB6697694.1 uroporphyrinogen-III C-methyltransferase [Clostridium algidicarnis]MBU3192908.1 uroporphyrinogen-III C-methyltransferase [Clostridium algidicarnis]MBU3203490.1 uroporphyrinogen-III C-methyltransferase [Clostridium algidicarnis]MBU3206186.1 uroporphyrinogen-III C-methyltransferase [Clostridium algidicarnis]MBU3211644.1 uroporphyrinogen-III C-methyltransferase [Clostridium algidicarnis]
MEYGKVFLIGTGPGDEDLLTIKAVNALKSCTAVLYDRLIGGNILKYLNEDCEIYYCGKEPGSHYKTQEEINEMLIKLSKKGHIVGRVKGGDPYVFGRGGEEALALIEENISFEVVPGITSAIAVPSYAGIPVTHRGISQSFHVFTAMAKDKLNIDWNTVSKLKGTIIFLMGLNKLEIIIGNLQKEGMNEATPCAVIMRGTTSKQRSVIGDFSNILERVTEAKLVSPCIIMVGSVVELSSKLNWKEKKPLFGRNICITRTKEQSKSIGEKLKDLGADITEINSIKIKEDICNLDEYKEKLPKYDYVVFTSVNAVNLFFKYLKEKVIDIRNINGRFACIGSGTYKALLENHVVADIIADQFVAEDLFRKLSKTIKIGDNVLIPCSLKSRDYITDNLKELGANVDRVNIYDAALGDNKNVNSFEDVDTVIFTSPSTFNNMVTLVGLNNISKKHIIAIGPITEKSILDKGLKCVSCDEYSEDGIINKLLELYDNK